MAKTSSTVLLAGIGRGPFDAIAPVLERCHLAVERVDFPEAAIEVASGRKFDLIIFDAEPDELALAEVVDGLRDAASASCRSSLLVVAEQTAAEEARKLIGRGINRVVTLDEPEEIIEQHVADLLDIAPRVAVRFTARLTTILESGAHEIVGQTANVSVTGLLIQTTRVLNLGQQVVFEFLTGDGGDMVSGEAEVVRLAAADQGGVDGIGIRFLDFHGAGHERIEAILSGAFESP